MRRRGRSAARSSGSPCVLLEAARRPRIDVIAGARLNAASGPPRLPRGLTERSSEMEQRMSRRPWNGLWKFPGGLLEIRWGSTRHYRSREVAAWQGPDLAGCRHSNRHGIRPKFGTAPAYGRHAISASSLNAGASDDVMRKGCRLSRAVRGLGRCSQPRNVVRTPFAPAQTGPGVQVAGPFAAPNSPNAR